MLFTRLCLIVSGLAVVLASVIMMVGMAYGLELKSVLWLVAGLLTNFFGCMFTSFMVSEMLMGFAAKRAEEQWAKQLTGQLEELRKRGCVQRDEEEENH